MTAIYLEDTWQLTPKFELRGGVRVESTNGWNEAHGRASQYGFTNGVINTTPTIGNSALSDNRAKFLPEPRIGIARGTSSAMGRPHFVPVSACTTRYSTTLTTASIRRHLTTQLSPMPTFLSQAQSAELPGLSRPRMSKLISRPPP